MSKLRSIIDGGQWQTIFILPQIFYDILKLFNDLWPLYPIINGWFPSQRYNRSINQITGTEPQEYLHLLEI